MGDLFMDLVHKTADSATICSKRLFLAYDITSLTCKKDQVSRKIGERVTVLVNGGTTDLTTDTTLAGYIARLNEIEAAIAAHEQEKNNLVNPFNVPKTACDRTNNGSEKGENNE